jgi:hypothetical protein
VGALVDDDLNSTALLFAEAGPELGKIIFIPSGTDWDYNLQLIQQHDPSVEGTYTAVDWSVNHIYRIEKTTNGRLQLFVDDYDDVLIDLDANLFSYPISSGPQVEFGVLLAGSHAVCSWSWFRYSISTGYDFKARPILSDNEVLSRFNHSVNLIVEAEA